MSYTWQFTSKMVQGMMPKQAACTAVLGPCAHGIHCSCVNLISSELEA